MAEPLQWKGEVQGEQIWGSGFARRLRREEGRVTAVGYRSQLLTSASLLLHGCTQEFVATGVGVGDHKLILEFTC